MYQFNKDRRIWQIPSDGRVLDSGIWRERDVEKPLSTDKINQLAQKQEDTFYSRKLEKAFGLQEERREQKILQDTELAGTMSAEKEDTLTWL